MRTITLDSNKKIQFIDITTQVKAMVAQEAVMEGLCTVFTPHTTAGIMINENTDPDLRDDFESYFTNLFPDKINFKHSEGNTDSHILSTFVNCNQTLIIANNKLILGTWQAIYFCDFDGPRNRKIYLQIVGK